MAVSNNSVYDWNVDTLIWHGIPPMKKTESENKRIVLSFRTFNEKKATISTPKNSALTNVPFAKTQTKMYTKSIETATPERKSHLEAVNKTALSLKRSKTHPLQHRNSPKIRPLKLYRPKFCSSTSIRKSLDTPLTYKD